MLLPESIGGSQVNWMAIGETASPWNLVGCSGTTTKTNYSNQTSIQYPADMGHGGSVVRFGAFCLEGRRFESRSSRHVGTLGKSFTHSCMWRFGVLTPTQYQCCSRECLRVVVDLKRRCRNIQNEGMI